jgi:putative ABC transport system substrate-binding protein
VDRRRFIAGSVAVFAAPVVAEAQQSTGKVPRIGVLVGTSRTSPPWQAFERAFRERGYVDGQNVAIVFRAAEGHADRISGLAEELARSHLDLIVTGGPEALVRAVRRANAVVPIVMLAIDFDPIATGYAASLARPGGNVTGLFLRQPELTAKRLEILREALPKVTRVAMLWDSFALDQLAAAQAASRRLAIELLPVEVKSPSYDFAAAIDVAVKNRAAALFVGTSPFIFIARTRVAELALAKRLPTVFAFREYAEAGGLIAYGANLAAMFAGAAVYADKILKGAKPADLPLEQPTTYELTVNLKTAKALGVTIPPSLLVRADQIIE